MLDKDLRLRSFMFSPAHNKSFLEKAIKSDADAIILDMEDGVPAQKREAARNNIAEFAQNGLFEQGKFFFVRINPIDTDDFVLDIDKLTVSGISGFVLSKVENGGDIEFVDRLLTFYEKKKGFQNGSFRLAPLIETTRALENIKEIAKASKRLIALCLGGEDYLNDLGTIYTYQESALVYPRAAVVNSARANGLLPVDTPYLNVKDIEGFKKNALASYKNGFAGCLIINPIQIEPANEAFSPNEDQIALSRRVIKAVKEADESGKSGVAVLDYTMVGPPMRKRAVMALRQIGEGDVK